MKIKTIWIAVIAISLLSCKSQYKVAEINGTIIEVDSTFDSQSHSKMHNLVHSFKVELDSEMNEVIGNSVEQMEYSRPESLLTNLTSDVMKEYGDEHLPGGADIGVMNVHGHRANMPKGPVTVGNLFEIYSFDNTITFLELKGSDLKKIFDAYARIGGAGISSNVKLVIEDRKVKSATINGKPIDNNKIYQIVTLDYLAGGNDNMSAFLDAVSITDTGVTLRDIMIDWVREQTRQGKEVKSVLDGRIEVKE
ncbi:MAG: 5'-nucleotidase C-terminal domain-containing protein [Fermentimonas sp.]|nr:5'-nucleotidase C-terminal domain-containing protein [Fermentimonas sp.]MDD4008765.1 5'-nucleotidase C-terminal domain-containing protein [Fermentimonas sp.]MDD4696537.1 5'-nucleotidase C-terminal domain-containing protein [Fermentimonas sp.]